ncbi:high mobility group b protein 3 [Phtheirospermum japonicum]|uniref:High mobility group b protein 3 n=1 Tax=Phtheirospermum japonicum TaxID=374723 RepID=A0A830CLL0_9LAMI|nr:high mobility group b protein 3 [Phtheirospermum japonicum]
MRTIVLPGFTIKIPKTMPKESWKFEITKQVIASIDKMDFSSDSENEGYSHVGQHDGGKSRKANIRRLGVRKQITKAARDPNGPNGGPSGFFVFMEEFEKEYKEMHPGIESVTAIGNAGGERWKSMSEVEKAPYVAKAQKSIK